MVESTGVRVGVQGGDRFIRTMRKLGDEGQRAMAKIETASRKPSRGLFALNAAARDVQGNMASFAGRLGPLGVGLTALGPAGLAAGAAIGIVGASLGAAIGRAQEAIERFDALEDQATKAGFQSIEAFQALRFAAEQTGAGIEAFDAGVVRLNRRIGLFIQDGGGPAAKAFQALGIEVRDAGGQVRSTEDIFDEAVRKLEAVESAAERSALASQLFGEDAGPRLTLLLNQGADGIARLTQEARDAGAVIDEALVREGANAADEIAALSRVIDTQLDAAFASLGPVIIDFLGLFAELAKGVRAVAEAIRDIEDLSLSGLERRAARLIGEIAKLEAKAPVAGDIGFGEEALVVGEDAFLLGDLQSQLAEVQARIEELRTQASERPDLGGGGGGADDEVTASQKVIDALQFELDQIGRTELGKRVMIELRRAGSDVTEEEAEKIRELTGAILEETTNRQASTTAATEAEKAQDDLTRAAERLIERQTGAAERLRSDIELLREAIRAGLVEDVAAAEEALMALEEQLGRLEEKLGEAEQESTRLGTELERLAGDVLQGNIKSWEDLGETASAILEKMLQDIILTQLGVQALGAAIGGLFPGAGAQGGAGGGLFGAAIAGLGGLFGGGGGGGGALPFGAGAPGPGGGFFLAKGGVIDGGNIIPLRSGGVLDRPTIIPLQSGAALAGEAGPEGILPLTRLPGGDLGVRAQGAGATVVQLNLEIVNEGGQPLQARSVEQDSDTLRVMVSAAVADDLDEGGPAFQSISRNFQVNARTA